MAINYELYCYRHWDCDWQLSAARVWRDAAIACSGCRSRLAPPSAAI